MSDNLGKPHRGIFITLEGPDGSGKTTQGKVLVEILRQHGFNVIQTREPGGSRVGEKIREILLNDYMCPMSELLLFAAARADHIESLIKPALDKGYVVISDRFADSTYAYQGLGRGYTAKVTDLEQMVHAGFQPEFTLFFDISLEESTRRLATRSGESNRIDVEPDDFKKRVYQGYLERLEAFKDRMVRIDASGAVEDVTARLKTWVEETLIPAINNK